eukprot:gene33537-41385_t
MSSMSVTGYLRIEYYNAANCGGIKTLTEGACGNAKYVYYSDSVCGTVSSTTDIPTTCTSASDDDETPSAMMSMKISCSTGSNPSVDSNTLLISEYTDTTTCSGSPYEYITIVKDYCLATGSSSVIAACSSSTHTATVTSYDDSDTCTAMDDNSSAETLPLGCINSNTLSGGEASNDDDSSDTARVGVPTTLYPPFVQYVPKTA